MRKWITTALTKVSEFASRAAASLNSAPVAGDSGFAHRLTRKKQLWFVADIPLFIDDVGVRQLYDALSRPEFETVSKSTSGNWSKAHQQAEDTTLAADAGLAPFLKVSGSAKSSTSNVNTVGGASAVEQEANRTAEMRIEKLISFYVTYFPERVLWTSVDLPSLEDLNAKSIDWKDVDDLLGQPAPRPLIVLDLKPGSKLLPMMAETADGSLKKLYDAYRCKLSGDGITLPDYPRDKDPDYDFKSTSYWREWDSAFASNAAMTSVEECTSGRSRIDWIDYRLIGKLSADEIRALHLHLCPRGRYSTGTFAYQMIRRGYKYGLRIVGTLKKGEDINVLAVYEV